MTLGEVIRPWLHDLYMATEGQPDWEYRWDRQEAERLFRLGLLLKYHDDRELDEQ